ncbi:MAG: hypothetical protein IJ171_01575, partial [Ruminococcus sp.]|nr:hypothetical protein [Ruminococcus sp.]
LHKYTFLGWYTSPEYNKNNPEENRLTTSTTLSKENLGTDGELPARDAKYYALVKQEMVQMDVDFYFCDDYAKTQMIALQDPEMKAYLQQKINDKELRRSGEYGGKEVIFSSPSMYQNHTQIAWHKNDGFSLFMQNIDNKVYKYEFAEWWEIDEDQNNDLIPKHNWNGGEWSPDSLASQLSRTKNQHLIAVYARRDVTELPYTVNYNFTSRTGEEKTYVKKGTLSGEELNENSENTKITKDGFYALTDEFILANAPYESNYGEKLTWIDKNIEKTSEKGDGKTTQDRIITDFTATQVAKTVVANYRTNPDGAYTSIVAHVGDNYSTNEAMNSIEAEPEYSGGVFDRWEVRRTENGDVIATTDSLLFDLCMMDNYFITPVYAAPAEDTSADAEPDQSAESDPVVRLTHIDYARNRWTDEDGKLYPNGNTDLLYTDFEIAFEDGDNIIHAYDGEYQLGVVFELCAQLPENATFDPDRDYSQVSDPVNLKEAISTALNGNIASGSYVYNPSKPTKKRNFQLNPVYLENLTNHDRIVYSKPYKNAYKVDGSGVITGYTNSTYLMKATAYLIKNGKVTLSNSVYICLKDESKKDYAIGYNMTETTPGS